MGFIVGITTMNTCKSLFLDITIRGKDYLLSFNLHLYISLYPNCTVWRMKWRKWRMAYGVFGVHFALLFRYFPLCKLAVKVFKFGLSQFLGYIRVDVQGCRNIRMS